MKSINMAVIVALASTFLLPVAASATPVAVGGTGTRGAHAMSGPSHVSMSMRRRTMMMSGHRHRRLYYGVGFGGHRRTTATGGNAGGYSDRN